MGRYSPQVSIPAPQSVNFDSIGSAMDALATQRFRNKQLGLQNREQDLREQEFAQKRDEYGRRLDEVSRAVPLDSIADASRSIFPATPSAPTNAPVSIGAAMSGDDYDGSDSLAERGGLAPTARTMPSRVAAAAPTAMNRNDTDPTAVTKLAAAYVPQGTNGGSPALAASRIASNPAPGDPATDPTERALAGVRSTLPPYISTVNGQTRVFDPAQEVIRDAAKQSVAQRLQNLYRIDDLVASGFDRKTAARMVEGAKSLTLDERLALDQPKIQAANERNTERVGATDRRTDVAGRAVDERGRHNVVTEGIGQENADAHTVSAGASATRATNHTAMGDAQRNKFVGQVINRIMGGTDQIPGVRKPTAEQAAAEAERRWQLTQRKSGSGGAAGGDNYTDAELVAAHNSGARTDDAIRAYITQQRAAAAPRDDDDE